jgi:hypothetical protein
VHKIDEKGTSALCVPSARSMTPALSSGCMPGEGGAETCGSEGRTGENQEVCRVGDGVRVAVEAGDIPSATGMGSTLGKSGELGTLTGESRNQACSLGRAHGAVCGPVRHSISLPFSPTPAPPQAAHQGSQEGDCSEPVGTEEMGTADARATVAPLAATDDVGGSAYRVSGAEALATAPVSVTTLDDGQPRPGCGAELEGVSVSTLRRDEQRCGPSARRQRRLRRMGAMLPHVRFLQATFRLTTGRWPGCWTAGGLKRDAHMSLPVPGCRTTRRFFTSVSGLSDLRKRSGSFVTFISLPSRVSGGSAGVDLVSTARDAGEAAGGLYVLETARGNAPGGEGGGKWRLCHIRRPRNSMHLHGPRFLCGAHCSPLAANSTSSIAMPCRVSSSLSPITRTSSTKT